MFKIRPLNRDSKEEIYLVAQRMKQTLIDVMGEEKGTTYYPEKFFLERLQWHIDLEHDCEIFLYETISSEIVAHAIVRIEDDKKIHDKKFSYFSTIYVTPEWRRKGIAKLLIQEVHEWSLDQGLDKITYSTAKNHSDLISLLKQFEYKTIATTDEMVRMAKNLKN